MYSTFIVLSYVVYRQVPLDNVVNFNVFAGLSFILIMNKADLFLQIRL